MRKICLLATLMISFPGGTLWSQQDSAPASGLIDVEHYEVVVEVDPERALLSGQAQVRFTVLQDALNLPFQMNNRLVLVAVVDAENRYSSRYTDFGSDQMLVRGDRPFEAGKEYALVFRFEGTLETEQYAFLDIPEREPVFIHRDGAVLLSQGNWFPSHQLPIDAATVNVQVTVPLGFTVVGPGKLQPIETLGVRERFTWVSSSPIGEIPVVVSRFLRERDETGPMALTYFVHEDFNQDVSGTFENSSRILAFLRAELGPLPLQELSLAQVGNVELSGKGSLGLVLMESSLFKGDRIPPFDLARRLALQWWGYSTRLEAPHDAWLVDGFATYSALRYLETTDRPAYDAELSRQAVNALKYQDKAPVSDGLRLKPGSPQYESIIASKGAWVLYMLGQLVDKQKLDSLVGRWFHQIQGSTASTAAFRKLVEDSSGQDLGWFFIQWLESVGVPEFKVDYKVFKRRDGSFRVKGQLKQDLDLFQMPVDLLIETKGEPERKKIEVKGRQTSFDFLTQTLPLRIRFDPDGKILLDSQSMRLRVRIAIGDEFLRAGEYVAAITEYEKAKIEDPRSSLVHYRLGETYFRQASYNLAANSFRDCLNGDLEPDWVSVWSYIHLGKIFDVLGQRQRALAEYQKAVNSGNDFNGAQAEAQKYLDTPFSKPSNVIN